MRLRLYGAMFPTVELDFSYYGMPKAANLTKMLETGRPLSRFWRPGG
jgi:uncharacterized protein YecE (DUF72 family)